MEMRYLGFHFPYVEKGTCTMHVRCNCKEVSYDVSTDDVLAQIPGPVTLSRWKDGSGYSAFDEDVNEDYPHRGDGASLVEAAAKLWLLKNRQIDGEFIGIKQ